MNWVIYLVLAASILALSFAFYFYKSMMKEDEGTDLMKKISKALGVILDDKPVKYGTTWDVKENILIVHTGK